MPSLTSHTPRDALNQALASGTFIQVRRMLNSMPPAHIAHFIETSPPKERVILWQLVNERREGEVLQALSDDIQSQLLSTMDTQQVAAVAEGLEADDMADILQRLPDKVIHEVLQAMGQQDRNRVERVLAYPKDTAGGLMNTDTITVRPKITLDVVLRFLRRHHTLPAMTDKLIVVNRHDQLIGLLPLSKVLVSDPNLTVREVMETHVDGIPASLPDRKVAQLFERNHWVSAPVVDEQGHVLGRITIDDVVDVIRDEADHSLMGLAGLDEDESTFAPWFISWPRRAVWLGANLVAAFTAASVIDVFQASIEKVVALAVLMPIVASMGGVSGTQALTVVIRGIALGQVARNNRRWLIGRETFIGLLNGLCWSLVIAWIASYWFNDPKLGMIIAAAIIINMLTAGVAGATLPMLLKALKIDPAVAGGVALTTVTDVVGFFSFLGLATVFYA